MIQAQLIKLRFKLKHWMVLNLYLATWLAAIVSVTSLTGPVKLLGILAAVSGVPMFFSFLSAIISKPGARRDLIVVLFASISFLTSAVMLSSFIFLEIYVYLERSHWYFSVVGSSERRECLLILLIALISIACWADVFIVFVFYTPVRCPVCLKRALISPNSPFFEKKFRLFWCFACGSRIKRTRQPPFVWDDASAEEYAKHYSW